MNIVEAFNNLAENYKIIINHRKTRYINIDGIIYRSLNNSPYKNIEKTQDAFTYEEIISTDWRIIEKED